MILYYTSLQMSLTRQSPQYKADELEKKIVIKYIFYFINFKLLIILYITDVFNKTKSTIYN